MEGETVWLIVSTSFVASGLFGLGDLGGQQFCLSMVISPTFGLQSGDFILAIVASCSFRADAAPASARSRHSVCLATETFASRATTSNGSPRYKHATTAILRWTE